MTEISGPGQEETDEPVFSLAQLLTEHLRLPERQRDPKLIAALTSLMEAESRQGLEFRVTKGGVIKETIQTDPSRLRRPPAGPTH